MAKVIPPTEWCARKRGYEDVKNFRIKTPISQHVEGKEGIYTQYNMQHKSMSVSEFEVLAKSKKYAAPSHTDSLDLERKYWKNLTFIPAIYGADVSGSLTDKDQPYWNINNLGTILDEIREEYQTKIEGVNTAEGFFTNFLGECPAFLRQKMTIIPPKILGKYSIPYSKVNFFLQFFC